MSRTDLAIALGRGRLPAEIQRAGGMQRLNWILDLAEPEGFIRELATEELYLLIKDIGEHDANVLLEYATPEQLQGIVDLEVWEKDEPKLDRWIRWLDLARGVNLETAFSYIRATEPELIQLLFTGEIKVYGKDLDIDEVPDDFLPLMSPDGTFWVVIERKHELADRLSDLMKLLWGADMKRMLDIFQTSRFELPSGVKEQLVQFRRGRLEDMGFVAPEDALEVYRRVDPRAVRRQIREQLEELPRYHPLSQGTVVEDLALLGAPTPDMVSLAIELLSPEERANFGQALTYLINRLFMARTGDTSQTDELPDAAREATSLVNLGLAYLADEHGETAAEVLRRVWPQQIFEVGNSLVLELGERARKLLARAGADEDMHLFSTPTAEVLEGLALQRPLYFEGSVAGGAATYRPFATLAELSRAEVRTEDAAAVLGFFEVRLGFSPEALMSDAIGGVSDDTKRQVRFETLFRTGLANALLGDAFTFSPLSRSDVAAFLKLAVADGGRSQALNEALTQAETGASDNTRAWMARTLDELVEALGRVSVYDLDPRYAAQLLLVRED